MFPSKSRYIAILELQGFPIENIPMLLETYSICDIWAVEASSELVGRLGNLTNLRSFRIWNVKETYSAQLPESPSTNLKKLTLTGSGKLLKVFDDHDDEDVAFQAADEVGRKLLKVFDDHDDEDVAFHASTKGDSRGKKTRGEVLPVSRERSQSSGVPRPCAVLQVLENGTPSSQLRRTKEERSLRHEREPANLGPDPISTIKSALASRFGRYKDDFAVARCREREYAIFLPEWALAPALVRRNPNPQQLLVKGLPLDQYRYVRSTPCSLSSLDPSYKSSIRDMERIENAGIPAPPANGQEDDGALMGDRQNRQPDIGGNRGNDQTDEEMENEEGELEEVEPALSTQRGGGPQGLLGCPWLPTWLLRREVSGDGEVCACRTSGLGATGRSCARFEASGEPESRHARRGGLPRLAGSWTVGPVGVGESLSLS
uniref:Uncharacterized protein n=1 Tax=Ananas comosus var. bracteatus TaxID=296719 RepID=A0A6V7QC56_ANACO|nr:unnamed protein product [Ananas comosus var. bracteatus]